ncbi:MAG: aminotransferase class V-fold PLP-dependent enzyme [Bacteroidota bacterium]
MKAPRRKFLQKLARLSSLSLGASFLPSIPLQAAERLTEYPTHASAAEAATDEDFWYQVRLAYRPATGLINLNNGGVSPHPRAIQEKVNDLTTYANEAPSFNMWRLFSRQLNQVKIDLAELAGCEKDQITIMRNATEALETVILGIDFKAGDEVLTTDQDYPSMLNTLALREKRDGIKVIKIPIPDQQASDEDIVEAFRKAITRKTRMIMFSHVVNLTGRVLPAQDLCALARENEIQSLVDGAHSFASLPFQLSELDCDYFGTSLHKWLSAPFGTGMLYVRKERIGALWPIYGYPEGEQETITKFDHLGTRSLAIELGIGEAVRFHNHIGTERKYARLQYLKHYWTSQVKEIPGVKFNTRLKDGWSNGLVNFYIEGKDQRKTYQELEAQFNIHTTIIRHPDVSGIRVSPNVYTTLDELDHLVQAIQIMAEEQQKTDK